MSGGGPDKPDDDDGMETGGELQRVELRSLRESLDRLEAQVARSTGGLAQAGQGAGAELAAPAVDGGESGAGIEAYGEFVKDELDAQEKRKASFEQRGLAVITTSGTLVTLLFALAALSTKEAATFALPHGARTWLLVSLGLFFVSAVAALVTNAPLSYQAVEADAVKGRLTEDPPRSEQGARKDIALTRVKALRSAKKKNGYKGTALIVAMAFQALAVGCVAIAISQIL